MEVSLEGLERLQSAARDFARAEVARIAGTVIEHLRSSRPQGVFGEVHARHSWDEYCWALQEGPFDDDLSFSLDDRDVNVGSLSGAFGEILRASILAEIEKLPKHAQVMLSALAYQYDVDENEFLGCISIDDIVRLVTETVNERASQRNLDFIGPNREDAIQCEVEGSGFVWSVLSDRNEEMNVISGHEDALTDPKGDLSAVACEMVDAFVAAAKEEAEGTLFEEFVDRFEKEIRSLLMEDDVLPSLEDIQARLVERLDE